MDVWYILQIILDIYLCGFVIYYIISYRKKEYQILKERHLRDKEEAKKINETLQDFLKNSEVATLEMIEAFKKEHGAIKKSINYLNMKMEELNEVSQRSTKLLNVIKEEIPTAEVLDRQRRVKVKEAADLLAKGFAPIIVAEKMNMSVGEIELIGKFHCPVQKSTDKAITV